MKRKRVKNPQNYEVKNMMGVFGCGVFTVQYGTVPV